MTTAINQTTAELARLERQRGRTDPPDQPSLVVPPAAHRGRPVRTTRASEALRRPRRQGDELRDDDTWPQTHHGEPTGRDKQQRRSRKSAQR